MQTLFNFDGDKSLEESFRLFHAENPHVYQWLRDSAMALKARGREHYGIGALCEAFRFHVAMTTTGDQFKLNNNHRAFYARLIMHQESGLRGFFELRRSAADGVV